MSSQQLSTCQPGASDLTTFLACILYTAVQEIGTLTAPCPSAPALAQQ